MIEKMRRYFIIFALLVMGTIVVSCTKMSLFETPFVSFDIDKSSPTNIYSGAAMDASYYVHLCSKKRQKPLTVKFSVIAGEGLKEGEDFEILTKGGTISFFPGIFDKAIEVKWLRKEVDMSKDCSLTLRLDSVSEKDIIVGFPGPDAKMKNLLLTKYQ